ncbi:MAG: hypothetical protein JJU05_05100 [Verrucomicrobia bacterium]|nr:hypothetical protein [Verrucomicrobiota bacterium]MCH8525789.1 hypothetical protein [Kiritimatiellia bacterium]
MHNALPHTLSALVAEHEGPHRTRLHEKPLAPGETVELTGACADWRLRLETKAEACTLSASVENGDARQAAFGLAFDDPEWTPENYVLLPGAVYNGNRFASQPYKYSPPAVGPRPGTDEPLHIGDLPRLSLEPGPSHLDQMSIDCAIPGIAIFYPKRNKALVILTAQKNELGPFGLEIIENDTRDHARLLLMSPGFRHDREFTIDGFTRPSPDTAADLPEGSSVSLPFHLHWIDCACIQDLFDFLFEHRQDCFDPAPLRNEIPFSAAWDLLHAKHNQTNWLPEYNFYQVSILQDPPNPFMLFQVGWVGGMMIQLPLIQEGDAVSLERCLKMFDFFFRAQTDYGLFYPFFNGKEFHGEMKQDIDEHGFGTPEKTAKPWTLVRRIGDALYFLVRSFRLLEEKGLADRIKPEWKNGLRKNVTAVLDIWNRQHDFGQYIDIHTGDIVIARSTAGALIPAALVEAARYFSEPGWTRTAAEIGEHFRTRDLADGVTCGGPGDCVQAPDSESVAALIESFILLHEETGGAKWLQATADAIAQTASWAMAYDYEFPEGTALQQIHAQSRGSFLANAQNKTAVPGICTLSGQGILRAYRATGNTAYLELLREISHTIPQYLGRSDKKIPTRLGWGRKGLTELPEGWICERVNVTQWGEAIGEISAYSCWCEVAMMLTFAELPGIYWDTEANRVFVLDHIEAETSEDGRSLRLHNPTAFPARVKLLAENREARQRPLSPLAATTWPIVEVLPNQTLILQEPDSGKPSGPGC